MSSFMFPVNEETNNVLHRRNKREDTFDDV